MKIEKNISIPEPRTHTKYEWSELEVGDSVFFEGQTSRGKARGAAVSWAANNNVRFTCRTMDGGVRIWRFE